MNAATLNQGSFAGGTSKDDDGEGPGWAAWAAEHIGLGLVSGVPVVRDIAGTIGHGTAYRMSPAADTVGKAGHLATDVGHTLGMIDDKPSGR